MVRGSWDGEHYITGKAFRKHPDDQMSMIGKHVWRMVKDTYVDSIDKVDESLFYTQLLDLERGGTSPEKPGMSHKEWIGEIDVLFTMKLQN